LKYAQKLVVAGHEKALIWLGAIKIGATQDCSVDYRTTEAGYRWKTVGCCRCSSAEPTSVLANSFITVILRNLHLA